MLSGWGDKVRVGSHVVLNKSDDITRVSHHQSRSNSLAVPAGLKVQKFNIKTYCNSDSKIFSLNIIWNLNSNKSFLCSINRMHVRSQTANLLESAFLWLLSHLFPVSAAESDPMIGQQLFKSCRLSDWTHPVLYLSVCSSGWPSNLQRVLGFL